MTLERELIEWLEKKLPGNSRLEVGLGDDAAVFTRFAQDQQLVVTTDLLTDGVDFLIDHVDPEQIGHKALGVNLSDLAAMAAKPVAAFVSLVLPHSGTERLSVLELAKGLYRGMMPLAEKFEVTIAGGDTNTWDGPLAISITALGETTRRGPLQRSEGLPRDHLLVTGHLGGSILGRHLQVEPRVNEALLMHERYDLHAGIDISDGLALDVSRLAKACGVGAMLDIAGLPVSDAAHILATQDGRSAVEHALSDGEDFELVLAVPAADATRILQEQPLAVPITRIGELIEESGLWQVDSAGQRIPLEPKGYQHGGSK